MIKQFIVASKNQNKIREIQEILEDFPVEVISMEQAGFYDDIPETGLTFEENALIKAKAIYEKTGGVVIADDSGLEVDALEGAPGIYSARFAGEHATDVEKIQKLLYLLSNVPKEKRSARFVCSIGVFVNHTTSFSVRGTCEGMIAYEQKGSSGFGYDPIFFIPEFQKTLAELEPQLKNRISHRSRALSLMKEQLKTLL